MRQHSRLVLSFALALTLLPNVSYGATKAQFQDAMRRLWSDHVVYTRLFIVDAAAGSKDKDATTQRLLQNQTDIGNAVAGFYGRAAGDKLTALLKDHILIAANIVAAAKPAITRKLPARTSGGTTTPSISRSSCTARIRITGPRPRCRTRSSCISTRR